MFPLGSQGVSSLLIHAKQPYVSPEEVGPANISRLGV